MIDQKTIEQIAKLARLQVTAQEAQGYAEQLSKVLAHFQEIAKLDTQNIQPGFKHLLCRQWIGEKCGTQPVRDSHGVFIAQ